MDGFQHGFVMRKIWIAMCFLAPLGVTAQEVVSKPPASPAPMIIEPTDADAFREIVAVTPAPFSALYIRWYTVILQRQAKLKQQTQEGR